MRSEFSKVIISLALILLPLIAGGQLAYANPGDVICSYSPVDFENVSIGDDGTLYALGGTGLYAINPNCTLKWQYQTSAAITRYTSPVIADDGTIYFLNSVSLYAVNPDGTMKWQQQAVKAGSAYQSPAIGGDGTVYVGDSQSLYAVNPSDGSIRWQYTTGSEIRYSPVIASDGTLYVAVVGKGLFAINPDGTLKWQYSVFSSITVPAVGNDGTIYSASFSSTAQALFALTPSGTLKWQYDVQIMNFAPTAVSIGSDGTIYYGKITSTLLYAMTPDGKLKWTCSSGGLLAQNVSSLAVGANGNIYSYNAYSAGGRMLKAINSADGTLKWQASVGGSGMGISSVPAIAPDGTIYVGLSVTPTGLYAVQGDAPWTYTDYQNSMKGYANSPWPRFKQNNFNTGHRPKMPAGVGLPIVSSCDKTVSIPITLNNDAKVSVRGINLTVTFDSSVITPQEPPATLTGGIYQDDYSFNYNTDVSGQVKLSIFTNGTALTTSGVIAYLKFNVVGAVGSTTKLTFTQSLINSTTSVRTDGSFTVTGCAVSGNVMSPTGTPVPKAQIFLDGVAAGFTDTNGNYTITASPGTHKISVSKSTDLGGVSGKDASMISRYSVDKEVLNCYQKIAADVNRDGLIVAEDAGLAAQYSVKLINCMNDSNPCVDWIFTQPVTSCPTIPVSYTAERTVTIPPIATGQNFIGIRIGDVTGDWKPDPITRSVREHIELRDNSATCNLDAVAGTLKMPIVLNQSTAIQNIDIEFDFDSSVLTANSLTLPGGILDGKGYARSFNPNIAGKVLATIYAGSDLFTGSGEVGYINFTVNKSQSTAITLKKFKVNEEAAYGGLKINGSVCQIPIPVVLPSCDPDFDGQFTMSDVIYYLQCIAGVRQDCMCNENLGSVIQVLRVLSGM